VLQWEKQKKRGRAKYTGVGAERSNQSDLLGDGGNMQTESDGSGGYLEQGEGQHMNRQF